MLSNEVRKPELEGVDLRPHETRAEVLDLQVSQVWIYDTEWAKQCRASYGDGFANSGQTYAISIVLELAAIFLLSHPSEPVALARLLLRSERSRNQVGFSLWAWRAL